MKQIAIVASAALLAGLILSATSMAQQSTPTDATAPQTRNDRSNYGWGPRMMMGPGMMDWRRHGSGFACDPHGAGFVQWRTDRIERLVKPTEAQRVALKDLSEASTKAAEQVAASCPTEFPKTVVDRLAFMEKRMDVMLQAIKTVRPAFDAFYATLTDEQKIRLNAGGSRRWNWHGGRD